MILLKTNLDTLSHDKTLPCVSEFLQVGLLEIFKNDKFVGSIVQLETKIHLQYTCSSFHPLYYNTKLYHYKIHFKIVYYCIVEVMTMLGQISVKYISTHENKSAP